MNQTVHGHRPRRRRPATLTVRAEVALIAALALTLTVCLGAGGTLLVLSPASPSTFAAMSAVLATLLVGVRRLILSTGRHTHPIRPAMNTGMSVER